MFDHHYIDWNRNRIKAIIDKFGPNFFNGKTLLDLGAGIGDISNAFTRLGATATAVEVRQEHINILRKKYPHIKIVKADLDKEWPFVNQKFDIVFDLGLICHLKDIKGHLTKLCKISNCIVLETEVLDSNDPNRCIYVDENKSIYDWSFNGIGAKPSPYFIERILLELGMKFEKIYTPDTSFFKYNLPETNSNQRNISNRRMWIITRDENQPIIDNQPKPKINKDISPQYLNIVSQNINKPVFATKQPNVVDSNFKVALCLSGHMRGFEKTFESINHNIIKPLHCDVFISTWDSVGTPFRGFDNRIVKLSTYDYLPRINYLYKPKKIEIEPFIHFPFNQKLIDKNYEHRDLNGMLSMYYKIKKCNELKKQYELENSFTYDLVIRCRADLFITYPPTIKSYAILDRLYLPNFFDWGGYNDQFAYGKSNIMDTYASLFDNIEQYIDEGQYINPEKLLKYHIDKNNIMVDRSDVSYYIRRDT